MCGFTGEANKDDKFVKNEVLSRFAETKRFR